MADEPKGSRAILGRIQPKDMTIANTAGRTPLGAVLGGLRERAPVFKIEHIKVVLDTHDPQCAPVRRTRYGTFRDSKLWVSRLEQRESQGKRDAFLDTTACGMYVAASRERLRMRLAKEGTN